MEDSMPTAGYDRHSSLVTIRRQAQQYYQLRYKLIDLETGYFIVQNVNVFIILYPFVISSSP
jgi:hypothetical protein